MNEIDDIKYFLDKYVKKGDFKDIKIANILMESIMIYLSVRNS